METKYTHGAHLWCARYIIYFWFEGKSRHVSLFSHQNPYFPCETIVLILFVHLAQFHTWLQGQAWSRGPAHNILNSSRPLHGSAQNTSTTLGFQWNKLERGWFCSYRIWGYEIISLSWQKHDNKRETNRLSCRGVFVGKSTCYTSTRTWVWISTTHVKSGYSYTCTPNARIESKE